MFRPNLSLYLTNSCFDELLWYSHYFNPYSDTLSLNPPIGIAFESADWNKIPHDGESWACRRKYILHWIWSVLILNLICVTFLVVRYCRKVWMTQPFPPLFHLHAVYQHNRWYRSESVYVSIHTLSVSCQTSLPQHRHIKYLFQQFSPLKLIKSIVPCFNV